MIQNTNNTNPLLVEYSESKKEQICENIGALKTDGDGSNVTATFTESTTKENITTGEPLGTIFGKIAKWFSSFATVAFSGKYTDLSEVPESFVPESHATTHGSGGNDPITPESIGALDSDSDVSNTTVEFTPSQTREAIATGESLATIFGKIAKWLADLKNVAFSGKYADLSEIPSEFDPSAHASTHSKDGSDPITPESIGAATASKLYYGTLLASGWSGNEQVVSIPGLPENAEGDVRIAMSATDDEFLAWSAAIPRVTAHSSGSVTITAYGDVPTINIPFEIYTSNVPVSVTGITSIDASTPTSFDGIVKGTGTAMAQATPNVDYATPSKKFYATLSGSGWSSGSQTVTVAGLPANADGMLFPAETATDEQYLAYGTAIPKITSSAANSITVDALGEVPAIDIPIMIMTSNVPVATGGIDNIDSSTPTAFTGILKGNGTVVQTAVPRTDYAIPSQAITATLLSTGWSDGSYTLSIVGITADTNGYIGLSQTASSQQRAAWGAALPYISQQTSGTIIISLDSQGTVPTIDIPLEVTIL